MLGSAQIGLGMPSGAEWLCLFAVPGFVVAIVLFVVVARRRRGEPRGFPLDQPTDSENRGPGSD
jgi:hypothetical protein